MKNNRSEEASCLRCTCRNGNPPFCSWLMAEIPNGVADDPTCEGFIPKSLRTSVGKCYSHQANSSKDVCAKRVGETENIKVKPQKTCPKKSDVETALKLKGFRGSIILEKIRCGKPTCHCSNDDGHGPYSYLHFWQGGKVRRRYLSKTVSALLSRSSEQLEQMLKQS